MSVEHVRYYLRKFGITPIPARRKWGSPVAKSMRPLLMREVVEFLEKHTGRPLHMTTVSEFSRDRLMKGVALILMNRFTKIQFSKLYNSFCMGHDYGRSLVRYARERAANEITMIDFQITKQYDGRE
jgi:hypothetical protein